ncbi:NAD(P)-dependent oxidoreductase [Chloroflexi bacterium TSY]|nr:NAD(P)-dependent oxidoreductase [Chloroflexi bacterium TSY]
MTDHRTILITGASGNLGHKLRRHLEGRYELRLLDRDAKGKRDILEADLSQWDEEWVRHFVGVDTVVHLAANPNAGVQWATLMAPNIDALTNVFTAAVQSNVKRIVYASSNHVMGGYKDTKQPKLLTTDLPPKPGTHYRVEGKEQNSVAYGGAKLVGERLGKCFVDAYGISFIAVRIGWIRAGRNLASTIPTERGSWFRLMWLSNRDYCQLMEKCIEADPTIGFAIVNGMSNNRGMRWDLESARELVGYEPMDDVMEGES